LMKYNLKLAETHEANSKAMSLWAKVPPFLPNLDTMPLALTVSIHLVGESVKELLPASYKRESNSTPLKSGLFRRSHKPKNSIVARERIQFLTTSLGSVAFLNLAISVSETKSSLLSSYKTITIPC